MENEIEIYYSNEALNTLNSRKRTYVFIETGLTPETIYSESDLIFYNDVAAEIVPEALNVFMSNLINKSHGTIEIE